ncbi:glycosyltransferase family 4 protein [Hephaestia sp. GCM10023244]|uniref:glycosyltransferase family 4 protein n=1 Tax=unclassified Hephaestia TaxID=2631281 RepID=UPI0020777EF2|nr:glycosyltransferase family 4 protein [Hephaestia sp. MAHUQ-44]MCM8731656.1 glycosyltransferase family 4 protein [Hephaestia sp. MAHUQ-44]
MHCYTPRHRILLLAEVAHPEMVSVPLIGWSLSDALARHADVHLVTHSRNADAIARQGWREGPDFTTIDTERLVRRLQRLAAMVGASDNRGWTIHQMLAPFGCRAFEGAAWQRFRPALEAGAFDIVHRLTPMSPTTPSILGPRLRRLGIPFVVGPWNGGLPWPPGFTDRMHREREGLSRLRGLHTLLPGYRSMRANAAAIFAGSRHTLSEIPAYARRASFYLPENAIDPTRFGKRRTRRAALPLRGAFVGRLVPYKCADILILAAADLLRAGALHLDIIGDGPERTAIAALVAELDVGDAVTLHGEIAHRRVQDVLVDCDFLACPSVREFGGGVVLEAMALGVAPIVADYGGPAELIDPHSGIAIPFTGPDDLRETMRAALAAVARDPARLDRLGDAAAARVAALFTWDRKAAQIVRVYDWIRTGGAKPDLLVAPDPAALPARHAG